MFVIPIKMKWMSIVYAAIVIYDVARYFMEWSVVYGTSDHCIIAEFCDLFPGNQGFQSLQSQGNPSAKNEFRRAVNGGSKTVPFPGNSKSAEVTKHKCAVCGRTEKDDPNLEFRFCSKCNGNYEYCQDHLYTHIHKK